MSSHAGFLFFSLIILIAFVACQKESPTEAVTVGLYQYAAYDTNGTIIVEGWMKLNTADSAHIHGEWHFNKVGNPQNIGPHFGSNSLTGGFSNSKLSLNLNRQYVDNNIFLIGDLGVYSFKGTWMWIGFPGELNHGTFEAVN